MAETTRASHAKFRTRLDSLPDSVREIPQAPLGPYGDIPVACAVFKVVPDDESREVRRTYYLHVNSEYCRLANCSPEQIVGASHLEVVKTEVDGWADECYRAAMLGEKISGMDYSTLTGGWVCYTLAPSPEENCCVFAFFPVDEQERKSQMSQDARTAQVISDLLDGLAGETDYETAMNGMLKMIAEILPSDRLSIYVCDEKESLNAFELCAEGVESQLGTKSAMSKSVLRIWFNSASEDPIAQVNDTSVLERFSPPLYQWCVESGIHNLLAAPFKSEGEIVGFLGAYNYVLDDSIDVSRVFSALSSFVGARMDNHRLIEHLAWTSEHDALTGLLNRRGAKSRLAKSIEEHPEAPVVVALMDLDDLKIINDQYGHAAGDAALESMGAYLTETFPQSAVLCRTGGDEFLVGLMGDDALRAEELMKAFSALSMEYMDEGAGVKRSLSASLGYACFPEQAKSLKSVFTRADRALYAVKRSGKSGYMKYSPEMDE